MSVFSSKRSSSFPLAPKCSCHRLVKSLQLKASWNTPMFLLTCCVEGDPAFWETSRRVWKRTYKIWTYVWQSERVQRSRAFTLDWLLLSGSEANSLIGHLNNYFLGGGEEWGTAKLVIGKKAVVTPMSQIKGIFACVFNCLDNIFVFIC